MARRGRKESVVYSIYIIELSRACTTQPCALVPLYVGQTAHTPEHRFAQHKAGGKLAASKAHKFGVRLRLDLMKGIGPFSTRKDAEAAEKAVAETARVFVDDFLSASSGHERHSLFSRGEVVRVFVVAISFYGHSELELIGAAALFGMMMHLLKVIV
jgi:hypothetical protein